MFHQCSLLEIEFEINNAIGILSCADKFNLVGVAVAANCSW